jgi:hypothetical protein
LLQIFFCNSLQLVHGKARFSGRFGHIKRSISDLLILLVGIQPVDNFEGSFPETDCDCDGVMTTLDLLMFLPQFGSGCE